MTSTGNRGSSRPARSGAFVFFGTPSITQGIADALVKDLGVYFLCDLHGQVPLGRAHGLGLYTVVAGRECEPL